MMNSRLVQCPTCKTSSEWAPDNPYRPFCSERCKLIDLNEWIEERRTIPGDPVEVPPQHPGDVDDQ